MKNRIAKTFLPAALAVISLALAAPARQRGEAREEFHQTYPLKADGRISLANLNGDVTISVWDSNEVKLDAVKYADSKEKLDDIEIQVKADPAWIGVETKYPRRLFNNNPGGVDYTLTVPKHARLGEIELVNGDLDMEEVTGDVKASSVNGRIKGLDLGGEVELSVVNGRLEVTFIRPDITRPVSLDSVNGRVLLNLPPDVSADLEASTVNGGISADFGLRVTRTGFIGHELEGKLGKGGERIRLNTVNGSIEVRESKSAN